MMRTEEEMYEIILGVARADERIRGVYLNGSRANPNAPKDIDDELMPESPEELREFILRIIRKPEEWTGRIRKSGSMHKKGFGERKGIGR